MNSDVSFLIECTTCNKWLNFFFCEFIFFRYHGQCVNANRKHQHKFVCSRCNKQSLVASAVVKVGPKSPHVTFELGSFSEAEKLYDWILKNLEENGNEKIKENWNQLSKCGVDLGSSVVSGYFNFFFVP